MIVTENPEILSNKFHMDASDIQVWIAEDINACRLILHSTCIQQVVIDYNLLTNDYRYILEIYRHNIRLPVIAVIPEDEVNYIKKAFEAGATITVSAQSSSDYFKWVIVEQFQKC